MKAFIRINKDTLSLRVYAHQKVMDVLNSIPGKKYNADERVFVYPIKQQQAIVDGLLSLNITIQEVREFPPQKDAPKIAYVQTNEEDEVEVLTAYSQTVNIIVKYNNIS